jgi:hypothetical protein
MENYNCVYKGNLSVWPMYVLLIHCLLEFVGKAEIPELGRSYRVSYHSIAYK